MAARAGGAKDVFRRLSHDGICGRIGALDYLALRGLPQLARRYVELLDPVQPMPVRLKTIYPRQAPGRMLRKAESAQHAPDFRWLRYPKTPVTEATSKLPSCS